MTVFESNRETLLRVLGVPSSQIEEEDVQIQSFEILDADGQRTFVETKRGNMFGRFFIQYVARLSCPSGMPSELNWTQERDALAQLVFAENWTDREIAGRQMLIALGTAVRIENIIWKS